MSEYLKASIEELFSLPARRILALTAGWILLLTATVCGETPLSSLRQQTSELLRYEATLDDGIAKDHAITALCDLYVVLRSDRRYASSEMLRADAAKVRRRLLSISRRRESRLKREKIAKPAHLSAEVDSAVAAALAGEQTGTRPGTDLGAPGGAALPDNGWQLVELIQRIVAPDFWDRQGGPGSIRYFAMRRVLVVRATSDVHQQIRDLLMALR